MTPGQARAARALLKLGVRDVAELAKVTPNTVSRVEQDDTGPRGPQSVTVEAIKRVYEAKGITFLAAGDTTDGGPGVRLRRQSGGQFEPVGLGRASPQAPGLARPKVKE